MGQPDGGDLKLFSAGTHAKGIFAVGTLAEGIVAVGVNAVGVVAVGVNAVGTVVAVGVNAIGLVALSAVNSIGIVVLSFVNAMGGAGMGWVNDLLHPVLSVVLVVGTVIAGRKLRDQGSWSRPELPPLVSLDDLQAGRASRGWTRAQLLDVELRALIVGNSDGQQAVVAPAAVLQRAHELLGERRTDVLVRVEVDTSMDGAGADYRAAAETALVLHAGELRPVPRRPWWPQSPDELRRFIARSVLWATAPLAVILTAVITALMW